MSQPSKQYYTFEMFVEDLNKITMVIKRFEEKRGQKFTRIYTPFNGGASMAQCLAYRLSDEANGHRVKIMRGTPRAFDPKILIVDDIADTGKTLKQFQRVGFFIATLFKQVNCPVEPSVYCRTKQKDWIVFWWEEADCLLNYQRI